MDRQATSTGHGESPELWLTPMIGMCLLGPLIWHWRLQLAEHSWAILGDHQLAHIGGKVALAVAIGVVPLFVTACGQRLIRAWKWPAWLQAIAVLVIGYFVADIFYYYALYPFAHWAPPQDEPQGNTMTIYVDDIPVLGILGAVAAALSAAATSWLLRRA